MSQIEQVLTYLKKGNSITSLEAIHKFRCTRLSAVIYSLREQGYTIIAQNLLGKNGKRYAEYTLIKENNNVR
jgi:hypothetical protein